MRFQYYDVDVGFFPTPVKVCFTKKAFYAALKDYDVPLLEIKDAGPLEMGVAETHSFVGPKYTLVVVVYNLEDIQYDLAALAGVIAHESSHVIQRILEHIGEQEEEFGEETRSYLLQHIVEQTFQGCMMEIEKNAKRKGGRAKPSKKDTGQGGTLPEVDKPRNDGGTGQDNNPEGAGVLCGAQGPKRDPIGETSARSPSTARRWRKGFSSVQY